MASENVEELKNLIKDGYKIISINISFEKPNTEEQKEKVEIKLVNGKNEKILSVENDRAFTIFSSHFQRFEDGYGNPIFLYVEDLDAYYKEIETQYTLADQPKCEISIGSRKLIEPFLSYLIKPGPSQPHGKASFSISILKNSHFKNIDFRDQILIKELDTDNIIFNGHVYNVFYRDGIATFLCRGGPKILHIQKLNLELLNLDFQGGVEALNFLSESVGIKINVPFRNKPNFNERNFSIICPILNLNIPNSFSISDVTFFNSGQSEDDKIIENSKHGKVDYRWNTKNVRAKTIIKAKSFFEAIQIGFSKISRTVDFIRLRVDHSFPFQINDKLNPLSFNIEKQYSRFELTTQVYCRDNSTKHALITDMDILIGHPLFFLYDPDEYFVEFYEKFKNIISKSTQELTKKESGIVSSLHWLSLAINTTNRLDKLLYLWNALEFIVSESKTKEKFNKSNKKAIINKIKELDLTVEQIEIIEEKIQQLNESPLMIKLRNEIYRNNIDLDPNELEILKKLRKIRNDVIHGKTINEINTEELEKFISIIERLLVSIISN
ncbi:MAG: hypothetical protein WA102_13855 [Candidatus Methanoperedens sp.]